MQKSRKKTKFADDSVGYPLGSANVYPYGYDEDDMVHHNPGMMQSAAGHHHSGGGEQYFMDLAGNIRKVNLRVQKRLKILIPIPHCMLQNDTRIGKILRQTLRIV